MKIIRWNLILCASCLLFGSAFLSAAAPAVLVPTNAVWKYRADAVDLGATWTANTYNDTSWLSGPAELGFGDGDEATVISVGSDPASRPVTVYFRKSVVLPAGLSDVTLRLLRDNGAVVYVNGVEVFRRCASTNADSFLSLGIITEALRNQIVQSARDSNCGRRHPRLIMPPQGGDHIRITGCHLILDGDGPVTCIIECSEDLLQWRPISTNLLDSTAITITDTGASTAPRRFYRIQPDAP